MDDIETYEKTDAGASTTTPIQAGSVKKGTIALLKGFPCKVVEVSTSKTGKHGHAKANIVGLDIFTGKKYEDICPTSHNMEEVVVKRTEMDLLDIKDDGFIEVMTGDGETREDLRLPNQEAYPDLYARIKNGFEASKSLVLTILAAMGQEAVVDMKEVWSSVGYGDEQLQSGRVI